jgi:SAM-dependent methyltransferase
MLYYPALRRAVWTCVRLLAGPPHGNLVGPIPRPPWCPYGNLRDHMAGEFIRGTGIEIGGMQNPLFVIPGVQVKYIDRFTVEELRYQVRAMPLLRDKPMVPVDVIDDGATLKAVSNESQDFVIANHILEHLQNPIAAIQRHLEVLRPGGILWLGLPDKRLTFDRKRPVTPLEHLYRDYREGPAWSFHDHVREWVELVENKTGDDFDKRVAALLAEGTPNIHYHVWAQDDLAQLLQSLRKDPGLPFDIEAIVMNRIMGESLCLLRKHGQAGRFLTEDL